VLRDAGRLAPIGNGIDFLGYIVRPAYRLVRQRVVGHMQVRLAAHKKRCIRHNATLVMPPAASNALQATLASYLGHFRHAQSARLQAEICTRHPWLQHFFKLMPDAQLQRVDRPAMVTSLASQWTYFRARYPAHVLLMQVGNRWECEGPQDAAATEVFRPTRARRSGLPVTWSMPAVHLSALKRRLTRLRQPWCEIGEHGTLKNRKKHRQLIALWPAAPSTIEPTQGI